MSPVRPWSAQNRLGMHRWLQNASKFAKSVEEVTARSSFAIRLKLRCRGNTVKFIVPRRGWCWGWQCVNPLKPPALNLSAIRNLCPQVNNIRAITAQTCSLPAIASTPAHCIHCAGVGIVTCVTASSRDLRSDRKKNINVFVHRRPFGGFGTLKFVERSRV